MINHSSLGSLWGNKNQINTPIGWVCFPVSKTQPPQAQAQSQLQPQLQQQPPQLPHQGSF